MKRSISKYDAKATVLRMFDRTVRPVLIGPAAVELKWPIRWAEELFEELLEEKKIRECTPHESNSYDVICGFFRVK